MEKTKFFPFMPAWKHKYKMGWKVNYFIVYTSKTTHECICLYKFVCACMYVCKRMHGYSQEFVNISTVIIIIVNKSGELSNTIKH